MAENRHSFAHTNVPQAQRLFHEHGERPDAAALLRDERERLSGGQGEPGGPGIDGGDVEARANVGGTHIRTAARRRPTRGTTPRRASPRQTPAGRRPSAARGLAALERDADLTGDEARGGREPIPVAGKPERGRVHAARQPPNPSRN